MNLRRILPQIFGLALFTAARAAHADAIPPDEAACTGKTAGAACMIMGSTASGTCTASKCTKVDYANWDGGGAPPSVEYDCLQCEPAVGDGGPTADSGTGADGGSNGKSSGGGCSASGTRLAGAWGLALVPMAIAALLRRRRRAA
jgi:hypothetical protein